MSKAKSLLIVFIAYLVAFVTSIVFLNFLDFGIILNVLCLDIIKGFNEGYDLKGEHESYVWADKESLRNLIK